MSCFEDYCSIFSLLSIERRKGHCHAVPEMFCLLFAKVMQAYTLCNPRKITAVDFHFESSF